MIKYGSNIVKIMHCDMCPERCKKWQCRVTFLAVIIYEKSIHRHIGCVDLLSSATGIFWVGSDSFTVTSILTLYTAVSDS